nr:hypothetical protein [Tanacetum cinerariifolium]
MLDYYTTDMCMQSLGRSNYARAMIELRADVELKDNIMDAIPKIIRDGYYTCNIRVEYEWKPHRFACYKIFGHVLEECPKNIGVYVTNNLKKTSQTPKGILNAKSSIPSTNPIMEKNNKMENLIIDGKSILVDNQGNPLSKVDEDSEDEVASVDNDMANFLAKKDGYGTQSLLEQWKDSHKLDDYEYDPYDDDLYEGREIPDTLQAFCDRLDIKASVNRLLFAYGLRKQLDLSKRTHRRRVLLDHVQDTIKVSSSCCDLQRD